MLQGASADKADALPVCRLWPTVFKRCFLEFSAIASLRRNASSLFRPLVRERLTALTVAARPELEQITFDFL